jgi:hypothetical protein
MDVNVHGRDQVLLLRGQKWRKDAAARQGHKDALVLMNTAAQGTRQGDRQAPGRTRRFLELSKWRKNTRQATAHGAG